MVQTPEKYFYWSLTFLIVFVLMACNSERRGETVEVPKSSTFIQTRLSFGKDTLVGRENCAVNLYVKNLSKDTLTVFDESISLTFLNGNGWLLRDIYGVSHSGPGYRIIYPGDSTDMGYTGYNTFFNLIPPGNSYLRYELNLRIKGVYLGWHAIDSAKVFVKENC